jgi:hypothetical protein
VRKDKGEGRIKKELCAVFCVCSTHGKANEWTKVTFIWKFKLLVLTSSQSINQVINSIFAEHLQLNALLSHICFSFLFSFFIVFTCAYNVWVISLPFPRHSLNLPPTLTPPKPSLPGRNYFALISSFVEERV